MRLRLFALAFLLVVGCASLAHAITYIAFEQVTVGASAVTLTAAKISPSGVQPTQGYCRLELAEIRYTTDGTTPTSTVGTLMQIGDGLPLPDHDYLVKFQAIRTTGVSGQLDCTYVRP
jgi:hypothetical protein